jgi:hypothetical protein
MTLRRVLLEALAVRGDHRLGKGQHYLYDDVLKTTTASQIEVMEALWQLVADGLAFIDYSQSAPENWSWVLTQRGLRAAESVDEYEPDDPEGYLDRLKRRITDVDQQVLAYASEALRSYSCACYLASSVMLGVASERAFQILGETFGGWLPAAEAQRFRGSFDHPRQTYVAKFVEFRKRLEPYKSRMPDELSDGMALTLDSVLDLLRITRNEAGHPTGKAVEAGDAYIQLQMFARYLEKLYEYRRFFLVREETETG